ncbi:MAG: transposase, partial [Candidatus Brocadia carolinensis]
ISEGNVSDVKVAHQLPFESGTMVVDDRGYNDYRLFGKRTEQGISFVTRMKNNTRYEVVKEQEIPVFLTNTMKLSATTIAALYKDRWQIELFFKAIKQNLKIKTFVGTSANAVKIQIWTALIAMLILKYLQLSSKFAWSLSNVMALPRMNLFTHRDIWAWLDKPFEIPPVPYEPRQLSFNFT